MLQDILTSAPDMSAWVFILLCASSFLTSAISSAFGLGGGVTILAIMAAVMPPSVVIPLHAVVQIGSNLGRAAMMHRHVLLQYVVTFSIGTVIGALVGGQVVITLPKEVLQVILGLFILYAVWAPKFKAARPSQIKFIGVGAMGSFATMFAGATGPLIAPFVAAACPERQQVVATHAAFMTLQHGIKIIVFGVLGFAFGPYIPLLVGMIAFGLAGTWSGKLILEWMGEKAFRIGLNTILTLIALRLVFGAGYALVL